MQNKISRFKLFKLLNYKYVTNQIIKFHLLENKHLIRPAYNYYDYFFC